jgi:hypothetical protein
MRMAAMDERLLYALRHMRTGELVYGVDGKYTRYLEGYAQELGYDAKFGNLKETTPLPCELVHEGYSKNCEAHALYFLFGCSNSLVGDGEEPLVLRCWYASVLSF